MSPASKVIHQPPDPQLCEITTILARGILRLRRQADVRGIREQKKSQDICSNPLDAPPESRLNVTEGLTT